MFGIESLINKMSDTITVYWAPALFNKEDGDSWEMFYSEPEPVLAKLMGDSKARSQIRSCPAVKDILKNTYSINSTLEDIFPLDENFWRILESAPYNDSSVVPLNSKVAIMKPRESSFPGYVNINYMLSWLFFADEPLEVEFTAPYFPAETVSDGALFSPGRMDIGKWYRPFNLDIHLDKNANLFKILEGQQLVYLKFNTDKKIVFKRYVMTRKLQSLAREFTNAPNLFGRNLPLSKRYDLAKRTQILEIVASEIKKNVVS